MGANSFAQKLDVWVHSGLCPGVGPPPPVPLCAASMVLTRGRKIPRRLPPTHAAPPFRTPQRGLPRRRPLPWSVRKKNWGHRLFLGSAPCSRGRPKPPPKGRLQPACPWPPKARLLPHVPTHFFEHTTPNTTREACAAWGAGAGRRTRPSQPQRAASPFWAGPAWGHPQRALGPQALPEHARPHHTTHADLCCA